MAGETFVKDMWDTIRQGDLNRVVALIEADRERLHMTTVLVHGYTLPPFMES